MIRITITGVLAREIIDSRGNPTVEAEIYLSDGSMGRAAVPSGASTGRYEALELRDMNPDRYMGLGVRKAVDNINMIIRSVITGMDIMNLKAIDDAMIAADATKDKRNLGANAILAVSMACADAASKSLEIPLFRFLGGMRACDMPVPMMNILNGGVHAANNMDIQEFMIMPVGADCYSEGLRWGCEVYHSLSSILKSRNLSVSVGDEGGFAPDLESDEAALDLLTEAVKKAGYRPGYDFKFAIDAAAGEWKSGRTGTYRMPKSGREYTAAELIEYWTAICDKYPMYSVEDPLDEEDWEGWHDITQRLGDRIKIVGDDFFVTNTGRLADGIKQGCANAILIKLNQIGTVSETLDAVKLAGDNGYKTIISHRSGETEDTFIAHLAVAVNSGLIKTGAPARSERVAKYNELLRIEDNLSGKDK
ncbi:MAG: phosphopyruvate hydratase [Lachnospiraceae bacterium]|nr:phosphopyruvate hydratase [Lachnospiraceae bacterium]